MSDRRSNFQQRRRIPDTRPSSVARRKLRTKRFLLLFPPFFREPRKHAKKIVLTLVLVFLGMCALFFLIVYALFLYDVPSIEDIQTSFKESSVIYDREGNPLYTIYGGSENRKYVGYDAISENIIHAVVAMEDQTFFSNPGFDIVGIIRSALDCLTNRTGLCGGGSTLSQQLIKNTLLTPERSIKRKVQEIWLSGQLNSRFSKEKILELYLNKISFGSNSDGVEQASQRFFGKSASDVNVLEASVLGSLPQAPTTYNPYRRRGILMGYIYTFSSDNPDEHTSLTNTSEGEAYARMYQQMKEFLLGLTYVENGNSVKICGVDGKQLKRSFSQKGEGCIGIERKELIDFWNAIQIEYGQQTLSSEDGEEQTISQLIEYQAGRKDRVLMRMFEDEYIDGEQLATAFVDSLEYEFQSAREQITYPHFVFYVREHIEQEYGEEFFAQGGWKIYTTIDPKLQDRAQEIVEKQAALNQTKFGVNNSALVALDNTNGEVVAMVGSKDFYDEEIDGEVNITTSLKQPGSSFKPIIFARAFEKNALSPQTPIFDVETEFGKYKPENYDGEYMGPMTIGSALAHSRNTTAVKMYFKATQHASSDVSGEYDLVEYLKNLGLSSIDHRSDGYVYGASISLGTAEIRPLEFAQVYSSFANNGIYQSANPILRIVDHEGNEIEPVVTKRQTLLPGAAYMITSILSQPSLRPEYWSTFLSVRGQTAASKTGTSNKRFGERVLPRDLWTVGYTPQITTVVWSGNTDGTAANSRGNGLEASGPIWKQFMDFAHEELDRTSFSRPSSILGSGDYIYIKGKKPEEIEAIQVETIEVDGLCHGVVTESTPTAAIKKGIFLEVGMPIEDPIDAWRQPVLDWINTIEGREYLLKEFELTDDQIQFLESPENACERPHPSIPEFTTSLGEDLRLFAGLYPVEATYSSEYPIRSLEIYVNGKFYRSVDVGDKKSGTVRGDFALARSDGNQQSVQVRIVDKYGYSAAKNYEIELLDRDTTAPTIISDIVSPLRVSAGSFAVLTGTIEDANDIVSIQFFLDGDLYGSVKDQDYYHLTLDTSSELDSGSHEMIIVARDFHGNEAIQKVQIVVE